MILIFALAAIPPLSEDQRVRLGDTADGRGYQEAAFDALVENVRHERSIEFWSRRNECSMQTRLGRRFIFLFSVACGGSTSPIF